MELVNHTKFPPFIMWIMHCEKCGKIIITMFRVFLQKLNDLSDPALFKNKNRIVITNF